MHIVQRLLTKDRGLAAGEFLVGAEGVVAFLIETNGGARVLLNNRIHGLALGGCLLILIVDNDPLLVGLRLSSGLVLLLLRLGIRRIRALITVAVSTPLTEEGIVALAVRGILVTVFVILDLLGAFTAAGTVAC
jgi:hypothetical protein